MGEIGTMNDFGISLHEPQVRPPQSKQKHYKDWPNAAAFDAHGDTRTKIELSVSGNIPDYAAGVLYRTGPGSCTVPRSDAKDGTMACSHWFDGFYTVHKFEIIPEKGACTKAYYTSHSQADDLIEHARKTGRLEGITFGQKRDPCDTLYKKFKSVFEPNFRMGNIGVALQDACPAEVARATEESGDLSSRNLLTLTTDATATALIDADTLEPLGLARQSNIHPALVGQFAAAHACTDPETGDIFNYNLELGKKHVYRVFQASPKTGKVDILAQISGKDIKGAYLHSMLLTENYAVLCIWSAAYTMGGLSIIWQRNIVDAIAPYNPNDKAIWLVIDRKHGKGLVKKFASPGFFSFHTTNAWEEKKSDGSVDIVCELVEFQNTDIIKRLYYENIVSDGPGAKTWAETKGKSTATSLARYKLADIRCEAAKASSKPAKAEKILHAESGDLPQINMKCYLKPHRYVWSVLDRQRSSFFDGIGKTDTQTKTCISWEHPRHTPGEPIFVPNPEAQDEDDGVILSVVFNGDSGASYLLCLDARTMKERGRVEVGRPVGFGFHGRHVPAVL